MTPYTVRLWLPVKLPSGAADTLWTRTIETAHTPRPGDRINLWPDDDDHPSGAWTVKEDGCYHDHDGTYNAYLVGLIPNPTDARYLSMVVPTIALPLYSDSPTDADRWLADAGWTEWDGEG